MSILTRKTTTPPTLEERAASAEATASAALAVFEFAAADLEAAADEFDAIESAASAEVERLSLIASDAYAEAVSKRVRASRIRDLIGATL